MSMSYTLTETQTFTQTHAKHMATKVSADLKRMQRYYGLPSDQKIAAFEAEVIELLKKGYLGSVSYGFKRDGQFIAPTLKYSASDLMGISANDDDPGRISPNEDISGASFYSFLAYSSAWWGLSQSEKETFENGLPLDRGSADEPSVNGHFTQDKTYSSGGRSLSRETVRSY